MKPSNHETQEQIKKALRKKEAEHDDFIRRRQEDHKRESNSYTMREKYEQLLKEAKQLHQKNSLTIDEPDEFCTWKDIPEDGAEEATKFE